MENQNEVTTPRAMIHLQVAGEHTQEDLVNLITQFQNTWNDSGVIATNNNVVANMIQSDVELSGMILTPKMTALEIATVAVDVLRAFDRSQGRDNSPVFAELEQAAQFVLRYGALPPSEGTAEEHTRDALFVSVVRSLGSKLMIPSMANLINVIRVAQKEGDEDFQISFKDLVAGDIFKHGEGTFVAKSNPYVNWIAQPLPVVTIDAEVYQVSEPVAPEDIKATRKPSKKKVQSTASKSTARTRKK
jgi:hypothetical protein